MLESFSEGTVAFYARSYGPLSSCGAIAIIEIPIFVVVSRGRVE